MGDSTYEPDERFQVVLSNPVGAEVRTASAIATIINDDPGLTITAASVSQQEGNSGSTAFSFTITRTGSTSGSCSVDWAVDNSVSGSVDASDFVAGVLPFGTVSFADGETSKTITLNLAGDTAVEGDEVLRVTLSNASGAAIATATASSTVRNDDTSLAISATDASKAEGNSGTTAYSFTVTRSGDLSGSGTVAWSVSGSGGDPANASDFAGSVLPSGTVSFAPNQTTQTITVNVVGDTTVEPTEGFTVTLSNPSTGTVLGQASATGSILDDDFVGEVVPLAGGAVLRFAGIASDALETGGLSALVGLTSSAASLYGLSNVAVTISSVSDGVATISASGSWGGKPVSFTTTLAASGATYTLGPVSATLDLGTWLGTSAHFQNHSNGSLTLAGTAEAPQFSITGQAEVRLDPQGINLSAGSGFQATLSQFNVDASGIVSFTVTPASLDQPFVLKLGEATLTLPRTALTYSRSSNGSGYTLLLSGAGSLEVAGADALQVDGTVTLAAAFGAGNTLTIRPTAADLEIVNTTPFAIAGTQFLQTGGLQLSYREDSSRSHGVLALSGSNAITLERLQDVQISLGTSGFDLEAALTAAAQTLAPTLWTLGSLDDAAGAQAFDLGLLTVTDIDLGGLSYLNRALPTGSPTSPDPATALVQSLAGSGLFQVMPLYPAIQDRFTIYGIDGTPLTEVVIDIRAGSTASTSISRSQQLTLPEKLDLFSWQKAQEAAAAGSGVEIETFLDDFNVSNFQAEFDAYTNYFQASSTPITTSYGTVSVNAQGQWTYTLNTANTELATALGTTTFQVTPRLNVATNVSANLDEVESAIPTLVSGMSSQAILALELLEEIQPLITLLERTVPLTGIDRVDNFLLATFQSIPGNAYRDDKLQLVELLDSLIFFSGSSTTSITGFVKSLSTTISTLQLLAAQTNVEGTASLTGLNLELLYRGDLTSNDPYRWLYQAYSDPNQLLAQVAGEFAALQKSLDPSSLSQKTAPAETPDNKTVQGQAKASTQIKTLTSLSLDLPAIYRPGEFLSNFLTEDRLNLFSLDLFWNTDLNGEIALPSGIPGISGLLGLEFELELALSLISLLTAQELELLGGRVRAIQADSSLSDDAKRSAIDALVSDAFGDGLGTDLAKNTLEATLTPYLGLQLGTDSINLNGTIGLFLTALLGTQRLVNGTAPSDQRIRFSDYYGEGASGTFRYEPTLGSLRLDLDHNYDFLLARGSLDPSGFQSFAEAYAKNSWLLNLQIAPLNLRELIGDSTISYDITLLEKLGNQLIDRIDWINIGGSKLVTEQGVDLFFEDAKFLNSAASNALRDALARQYPNLTAQELGRLLSLIVDHGTPTRVSYALADSNNIDARINEMRNAISVRTSSDSSAPLASTDRFRLRYEENNLETAVDSYLYYGLNQPKYVDINPDLNYNYAAIEFDLISEGENIELDLHFYDGSSWRLLGSIVDTLSGTPTIRLANPSGQGVSLAYRETASADPDRYVHNSGTLTLQLALVHMDGAGASADEQLLRSLAARGELQLRLQDSGSASPQATFMASPRLERGGAIYTNAVDSGALLRQAAATPWTADLASGAVQWLQPTFFDTLAARSDLAFLTNGDTASRSAAIYQFLNPHAPLAVQLAVNQMEARSSNHLSASQSGTLASAVNGVMRFTHDPVTNTAYKSYIGADGLVRIAARSFDGQDWLDIATLADLQLQAGETHAPDLVALGGQLVVASWTSSGTLVTYVITPASSSTGVTITQGTPASVDLDPISSPLAGGSNRIISAAAAPLSNRDLQIGLEKRLDLTDGSTSLQKAYYLSVLDPIQQVYATSANAVRLNISGYSGVANAQTLAAAAAAWADPTTAGSSFTTTGLESQLEALLGFGEASQQGLFSSTQPGGSAATVRGAAFMEFASLQQLQAHLAEWGSGSVFVVVGDSAGNAMVWNYDGDAYTRANGDRLNPEAVLSSGRVYNLAGLLADGLSVVYKPTDQNDALVGNWEGLVDPANADYRQVPGTSLRSAEQHSLDDLVAGGNVALLVTGTAHGLAGVVQTGASSADVGGALAGLYSYADGTPILRYFSSERFADANGVYHWFDAGNLAPLQLSTYSATGLSDAQLATATLNSAAVPGGLGWVWTAANPLARGSLTSLDTSSRLGFIDANSLNLAISDRTWQLSHAGATSLALLPGSIALLPSTLSPELFFSSQGSGGALHLSISAGARSEMGLVLHGEELLNPERLDPSRELTAYGVLQSFFDGSRPFLSRGDYVPLAYYRDGEKIYYGNLNAPVELRLDSALDMRPFAALQTNAVTPLGFEGGISDYVSFGVVAQYGEALLELIRRMPSVVSDNYFQFVDNNFNPINIG
ncbi:MAG: Calx-beta domain-containing protein, partial [Cyanobacteriota bacterium]|nr:Calx-beta domain-containing protein [Cyanobacteriota bacterium]